MIRVFSQKEPTTVISNHLCCFNHLLMAIWSSEDRVSHASGLFVVDAASAVHGGCVSPWRPDTGGTASAPGVEAQQRIALVWWKVHPWGGAIPRILIIYIYIYIEFMVQLNLMYNCLYIRKCMCMLFFFLWIFWCMGTDIWIYML